jgi:hypothetical protein
MRMSSSASVANTGDSWRLSYTRAALCAASSICVSPLDGYLHDREKIQKERP